jgi:DNA invertase Pin-like site-specific DNA recombinase/uncharacterized coiled-coil protein SlyX
MGRIAYSYVRFSTPEQARGDSLKRQVKMAEDYAKLHGLTIDRKLKLRDLGVSSFRGDNAATGALRTFLTAIEKKKVVPNSVLLVENLDRLSRDEMGNSIELLLGIIRSGIEVVTLCDGRRFSKETINSDPMALMLSVMVFFRAHEESATKSRRVGAAWKTKRENAHEKKLTAKCPAWLTLTPDKKSFTVDPKRAAIVCEIFRRTIAGEGKRSIAKSFFQDQLEVWGRGTRWHDSYVQKILHNRAVIGEFQPHKMVKGKRQPTGDPIPGYFPAIVDVHTFNKTQSRLRRSVPGRVGKHVTNLFSGLVECGFSGQKMRYVNKGTATRGKGRWRYLVTDTNRFGMKGCSISYALFEEAFLRHVAHLDWQAVFDEVQPNEKIQQLEDQIQEEKTKLARTEKSIKKLTAALEDAGEDSTPKTILTRIRELETQQEAQSATVQGLNVQLADEQVGSRTTIEDAAAFSSLATKATKYETRLRLRDEIHRCVAKITLFGKYTVPRQVGRHAGKRNPVPSFTIEFANGVTRDVMLYSHWNTDAIGIHDTKEGRTIPVG